MAKIDWMIDHDFLAIEYFGRLPMIVFTERGWEIERDRRAEEFLAEWNKWLQEGRPIPDMNYLKDRNRKMILLFIKKVRETGETTYIPYLEAWKKIDYKKVQAEIQTTIKALKEQEAMDSSDTSERKESLNQALRKAPLIDIHKECWKCDNRFTFTIGEQKFYKQKGLSDPKLCEECRLERELYGGVF